MSIALALLSKIWPYVMVAALAATGSAWLTHKADNIPYGRLQTTFASFKAQVSAANAAAEKGAREALQAQIDERHAADVNNEQVMNDLRQRTLDAESHRDTDRNLIRGLLFATPRSPAPRPGHPVPQADDQRGIAPAGPASGPEQVVNLCADTKAEDEWNADHLDGLLAELKKQM